MRPVRGGLGSCWEIEIKRRAGKLGVAEGFLDYVSASGFDTLDITPAHGLDAAALPLHHKNPFDRVIIAQARCEALTLVTRDKHIQAYDVPLLVV